MSSLITINVCGRQFQTTKSTLYTSPYFRSLLERWDNGTDRAPDGSHFIDADPDVFEHLLTFMRRPSKFPLFWTKEKGFDYVLYNKLEADADYFLLHDLRDWIRKGRYRDAVQTVINIEKYMEPTTFNSTWGMWKEVDEIQYFLDSFHGRKKYRCPLDTHGSGASAASSCGSDHQTKCAELVRLHGAHYDDPYKHLIVVVKMTRFDDRVCRNESGS